MATLYQSTINARRIFVGVVIVLGLILILDIISRLNETQLLESPNTPRFYMNTTRTFGEIERPVIPAIGAQLDQNIAYTLTGFFEVEFPDVAYVYKIEQPREKLFAFENAQNGVKLLGFNTNIPIENVDRGQGFYEWSISDGSKAVIFSKIDQIWDLRTVYANNIEAKKQKFLSSNTELYERNALRLIQNLKFTEGMGLEEPRIDVVYAKLQNGTFVRDDNYQQAEYVFVNIYRRLRFADLKPRNERPEISNQALTPEDVDADVYTNDPREGSVSMVVSNSLTDYAKDVFELEFQNFEYGERSAYLIVKAEEAWSQIQLGRGALVSLIPQGTNYLLPYPTNVTVTKLSADRNKTRVAYWEPDQWIGYAYPIYVFEGTATLSDGRLANFIYFVEAIKRIN